MSPEPDALPAAKLTRPRPVWPTHPGTWEYADDEGRRHVAEVVEVGSWWPNGLGVRETIRVRSRIDNPKFAEWIGPADRPAPFLAEPTDPATPEVVEAIARACHEANRAFCLGCGDATQLLWDEAEAWQRESAIRGVRFALDHPDAPDSAQHDAWMADKVAAGWTFGVEKDPAAKTHPCLVPFDQLPPHQQAKDRLFRAVVAALAPARAFDGQAVHGYFSLSYASWLVLPRLLMQSMPGGWQRRLLGLLAEAEARFGPAALGDQYEVRRLDAAGRPIEGDPLADYRHGRLDPAAAAGNGPDLPH